MFSLAMLVLIAVGVLAFLMIRSLRHRRRFGSREARSSESAPEGARAELEAQLGRWVAAGLLTHEQSSAILAYELAASGPPASAIPAPVVRRTSPAKKMPSVAEALGYLGGTLALSGLVLLVSRYWPDLALGSRLALVGAAALLLPVSGFAVRVANVSALERLRAALWLAATAATAVFVVVAVRDWAGVTATKTVLLASSGAVATESGLLWWGRNRPVQQLTLLAGATGFIAAAVAEITPPPGPSGLAVWAVGSGLVVIGLRSWLPARLMTAIFGVIAIFVGAVMAVNRWHGPGLLLLLASASAVLALAVVPGLASSHREDQLTFGILGTGGLILSVPETLAYFSHDAGGATGLITYAAGVGLLYLGIRRLVRLPDIIAIAGAAVTLIGASLVWNQWHGVAPIFGAATAAGLIAAGVLMNHLALSMTGSLGLLINVPWIIVWYFPGQGRAPLLTVVSGALILGIALAIGRTGRHTSGIISPPRHP